MTELADNVEDLPRGIKMSIFVLFYSDSAQSSSVQTSLFIVSHVICGVIKSKKNSCWQKLYLHLLTTISKTDPSPNESSICITHRREMIHSGVTSHFGFKFVPGVR